MSKPKYKTIVIDDCPSAKKVEWKGREWFRCADCEHLRKIWIEDARYREGGYPRIVCVKDGSPKYLKRRKKIPLGAFCDADLEVW